MCACVRVTFVSKQQCFTHHHALSPEAIVWFYGTKHYIVNRVWVKYLHNWQCKQSRKMRSSRFYALQKEVWTMRKMCKININCVNTITNSVPLFISVFNQLDAQNLFHNKFYFMPLHVSSTCAHHQEVKIVLHSLWYHHTYRWNKFCTSSWLNTEINILRCTVSKTSNSVPLVNLWNHRAEYFSFEVSGSTFRYRNSKGFIWNPEISAVHNNKQWRTGSNYNPITYGTSPIYPITDSPHFIQPEGSSPPSQQTATLPYPKPDQSSLRHPSYFLRRPILIISLLQCLGLVSGSPLPLLPIPVAQLLLLLLYFVYALYLCTTSVCIL